MTGPDAEDFARALATARTSWRQRWLREASYVLGATSIMVSVNHVAQAAPHVRVTPGYLLFLLGVSAIAFLWRPRGWAVTLPRFLLANLLLFVPVLVLDVLVAPRVVLFHLPWWIIGPLVTLALGGTWWDARRTATRRRSIERGWDRGEGEVVT